MHVVLNPAAIAALGKKLGGTATRQRGERVADAARRIAPVGPPEGGHYRDKITVDTNPEGATRVRANVPYAEKLETKDRILGSALDAARG